MNNQKAIVTGASRGIGRGIALSLARAGYDLAISYRTKEEEARKLKETIESEYHSQCHIFQASLEQPGEGKAFFHKAVNALGGLDLLVNNAGITVFENILELSEDAMRKLISLDFINYLCMMQQAAVYMKEHQVKGNIINITSSRAERAYPEDALYGGIKAGINRAAQSIALDLAPYGIRVNCVAPGAICIRSKEELEQQTDIPIDFWEKLGGRIPLGRNGTPEDIGEAVVFLASEKSSYITGITLRVDGGLILPGMPECEDDTLIGWNKK